MSYTSVCHICSYVVVPQSELIIASFVAFFILIRSRSWLWAAFSFLMASFLVCTAFAYMQPVGRRAFHFFGMAILFTASIAYFSMASNLG